MITPLWWAGLRRHRILLPLPLPWHPAQYERALTKNTDVDKVELEVDGIVERLLQRLFGVPRIADQVRPALAA